MYGECYSGHQRCNAGKTTTCAHTAFPKHVTWPPRMLKDKRMLAYIQELRGNKNSCQLQHFINSGEHFILNIKESQTQLTDVNRLGVRCSRGVGKGMIHYCILFLWKLSPM